MAIADAPAQPAIVVNTSQSAPAIKKVLNTNISTSVAKTSYLEGNVEI